MKGHILLGVLVAAVTLSLGYFLGRQQAIAAQIVAPLPDVAPLPQASKAKQAFAMLLTKSPREISRIDLGTLNAACLGGLPGTDGIDLDQTRAHLDQLAALVKNKTAAALETYAMGNPAFKDSPQFRAMMLVGTLQDDYRYAHETYQTSAVPKPPVDDQGASRPEDRFFHGAGDAGEPVINNPVLFVAVGQRLGYPLHLVAASGYLFARWDDGKTRFDLEENEHVMFPRSVDYTRREIPITDDLVQKGHFFESLSTVQAFAVLLQARGNCMARLGRAAAADEAYAAAHRFAPEVPLFSDLLYSSIDKELTDLNYSWKMVEDADVERLNLTPRPAPKEIRP